MEMKLDNRITRICLFCAVLVLLVVVFLNLSSCKLWTVVKLDGEKLSQQEAVQFRGQKIDIKNYVDDIWDSKVIPYMEEKANDISSVLDLLRRKGKDIAGEKHGIREYEMGTPWKFIVKGQGKIISVNAESRNGTIGIDLKPYDSQVDLEIQIGPVISGNLIRDSLDFVSFGDFTNQMEYSKFGSILNDKVKEQVLSGFDFKEMIGYEIEFLGIFTAETADILLTPVKIEIVGGKE